MVIYVWMRLTLALVTIKLVKELSSKQLLENFFTMCLPALDYIVVCDHKNADDWSQDNENR